MIRSSCLSLSEQALASTSITDSVSVQVPPGHREVVPEATETGISDGVNRVLPQPTLVTSTMEFDLTRASGASRATVCSQSPMSLVSSRARIRTLPCRAPRIYFAIDLETENVFQGEIVWRNRLTF